MNIKQYSIRAKNISLINHNIDTKTFQIKPEYLKRITKIEGDTYKLDLVIKIVNSKENPFPLDIVTEFEAIYCFSEETKEEEIINFLNIGAIQMVFPFMRSAVNNVITSALLPPLVIPIVDVRNFKEY